MKKLALLIGLQGSGKTHFAKKVLTPKGYEFVNGDIFLSPDTEQIPFGELEDLAKEVIKNPDARGIVFEFSNSEPELRKKLIDIGKRLGMKTEYFVLKTPLNLCLERNSQREGNKRIPEKLIRQRNEALTKFPPDKAEGVDEIHVVV